MLFYSRRSSWEERNRDRGSETKTWIFDVHNNTWISCNCLAWSCLDQTLSSPNTNIYKTFSSMPIPSLSMTVERLKNRWGHLTNWFFIPELLLLDYWTKMCLDGGPGMAGAPDLATWQHSSTGWLETRDCWGNRLMFSRNKPCILYELHFKASLYDAKLK